MMCRDAQHADCEMYTSWQISSVGSEKQYLSQQNNNYLYARFIYSVYLETVLSYLAATQTMYWYKWSHICSNMF